MSSISSKRAHMVAPALFTSVSTRPNAITAPVTMFLQSRSSATSAFTATTRAPSAPALFRDRLELGLVARREHEPRALGGELPRQLRADALRRAGDDDHVVLHFVGLRVGDVVEGDVQPAAVARLVGAREIHGLLAEAGVELVERPSRGSSSAPRRRRASRCGPASDTKSEYAMPTLQDGAPAPSAAPPRACPARAGRPSCPACPPGASRRPSARRRGT